MKSRILEIREIELDLLLIARAQVRTRRVEEDVDELAGSIEKIGLLEPIVVYPAEGHEGKFEIVTGQRRFLAHQSLRKQGKLDPPVILAAILAGKVTEIEAKVISLTENLVRKDLDDRDYVDVCTHLFKHFGSIKAVADELGLRPNTVSKYVKFEQLPSALKERVREGKVDLKAALRATKAATDKTGKVDEGKAAELAVEMTPLSGVQQKKIVTMQKERPEASVSEIIEEAKTTAKVTQVLVDLSGQMHAALQKFASDEEVSQNEAAATLIEEGLVSKGLVGGGDD